MKTKDAQLTTSQNLLVGSLLFGLFSISFLE